MVKHVEEKVGFKNESNPIQNEVPQQNLNEDNKNPKTKKALRKLKKRQQLEHKKNALPAPKKVQYIYDTASESIIIKGEIDESSAKKAGGNYSIRFKLSGQKDFLEFGYQAKIPITKNYQFQFEVLESALLAKDCIAIQLYSDVGHYSDIVFCEYERKQESVEETIDNTEDPLSRFKKSQQINHATNK
ncbi:hypothetical protein CSE16_17665 [Solibacillus sp. R5-41]|uniref:hypothetical protein n=1 Tax=Solibacillus sp. R5-41 TaxID=2048654 RepID=UPI000C126FC5|nr:hypothetical protein [Solibacillus sp. R5-41]ATP41711.1 hypothetical protein CSE16_17665 [Solibacillus sp. R5-41]